MHPVKTVSDSPELLYLRKYQQAVMSFNRLERNMAFCIGWAARSVPRDVDMAAIHSYSYDKKLRKIRLLVREKKLETAYTDFLDSAERCRLFRNKMVHGDWQFVAHLEQPIRFHVLAPHEERGSFTQEEFAARVDDVEAIGSLFSKLRKEHPIEYP